MKKLLVFAAAIAALAAVTSCSNDEDLVQAQIPEPEVPVVKNTLKINVNTGALTRGDSINNSTFDSFTLFATKNGGTLQWWQGGNLVSRTKSNTTWGDWGFFDDDDLDWGGGDGDNKREGAFDFYAISDVTNAKKNSVENINFSEETGRNFWYTVPGDWDNNTDLLVARSTGTQIMDGETPTGYTGIENDVVNLNFKHALAAISKVNIKTTSAANLGATFINATYFYITGMRLVGLKDCGLYVFSDTDSSNDGWSSTDSQGSGTFEIKIKDYPSFASVLAMDEADRIAQLKKMFIPVTATTKFELPIEGSLFLLPQTVSSFVEEDGTSYKLDGVYVEFDAFLINEFMYADDGGFVNHYTDTELADPNSVPLPLIICGGAAGMDGTYVNGIEEWDGAVSNEGMGKIWCPLSITVDKNKNYTLNVDITKGICDPAAAVQTPSSGGLSPVCQGAVVTDPTSRRIDMTVEE